MRALLTIGAIALTAGCMRTPELQPAAGANQLPGDGVGAAASEDRVQVEVRAGAWDGAPRELDAVVPLKVTVDNDGERPLMLRFREMQLEGSTGVTYAALPPFDIRTRDTIQVTGAYPYDGFFVAPHLRPWYGPAAPVWPEPLAWDPLYYDRYYPDFVRVDLPTESMIERALPEGVLQPGGQVTGFVYFQPYGSQEQRLVYVMDLVDARTGLTFGTIEIPFQVNRPAS